MDINGPCPVKYTLSLYGLLSRDQHERPGRKGKKSSTDLGLQDKTHGHILKETKLIIINTKDNVLSAHVRHCSCDI